MLYIFEVLDAEMLGPFDKTKPIIVLQHEPKQFKDLADNGLESLAFCCISTGVFMFPNQRAAEIAVETVRNWLDETGSRMKVVFNVYKDLDLKIYSELCE